MIEYRLSFSQEQKHYIDISVTCAAISGTTIFILPVWTPGSYVIRNHSRHIVKKYATLNGHEEPVHTINKNSWSVNSKPGDIVIFYYTIYSWDWSVRTCVLEEEFAHIVGAAAFVRVLNLENEAHVVRWEKHKNDWTCATAMKPYKDDNSWVSAGYDEFIDHPMLLGNLTQFSWDLEGIIHHMAITTRADIDRESIIQMLSKIILAQKYIFGSPPKVLTEYYFLVITSDKLIGGLEHRRSSSLICPRISLQCGRNNRQSKRYIDFLSLCSHEHFHMWWVKLFKPKELVTYDYDRENYTSLLWLFEGMTSYYGNLSLVRSGVTTAEEYLLYLAKTIKAVESYAGYDKQTAAEASFESWTKYYQTPENRLNSQVSYYEKGELIALYTNCYIMVSSGGKYCLDNVLRELWARYGSSDHLGMSEEDWYGAIIDVTGIDASQVIRRLVHHHDHVEWEPLLSSVGISYKAAKVCESTPSLGVSFVASNKPGLTIDQVLEDGSAMTAGLGSGDRIIAIDQIECTESTLDVMLNTSAVVGNKSTVHFIRQGLLRTAVMTWLKSPLKFEHCSLTIDDLNHPYLRMLLHTNAIN